MYTEKPLYVAFVWHMHQPYYKNLVTGEYTLPWVRLHCCKDYYDMLAILDNFPQIKQTFNLVPSLMIQIEDYAKNNANDKFLELTLKEAIKLTPAEKIFILHNFFMANWETMVKIYPRYEELLSKRGYYVSVAELERIQKNFSPQEIIDLVVLFNLSWIDPYFKNRDEELKKLINKGEKFSEEDKALVIKKQKEIILIVLNKYKEMQDKGQIEVTTTPFYHPILPLICNSNIAKISNPNIILPNLSFVHPEDAHIQVKKAVDYYTKYFGKSPQGMWPAEGSVSEEIVSIIADAGLKWIASDEEILAHSLDGMVINRGDSGNNFYSDVLYKPYKINVKCKELNIVFRDRELSDLIGFSYSTINAKEAVKHFIHKLHSIRKAVHHTAGDHLVSIILDGENAWEFYPDDGREFLYNLYTELSNDTLLKTTTVSDYLNAHPPENILTNLYPGSWINHNYNIWIGNPEDNIAWDYLSKARTALKNFQDRVEIEQNKEKIEKAWEEIYIAEGSDWNWWYGDDHSSGNDEEFDKLYRQHLMNIYKIIGEEIPDWLFNPIKGVVKTKPTFVPVGLINPKLDGKVTDYFEWHQAGFYDVRKSGGTMHQSESIVKGIYYGFNLENLFFRIDTNHLFGKEEIKKIVFDFRFLEPPMVRAELSILSEPKADRFSEATTDGTDTRLATKSLNGQYIEFTLYKTEKNGEIKTKKIDTVAINKIIEVALSFNDLGIKAKETVNMMLVVKKEDIEIERWPHKGIISLSVPDKDYILDYWNV